MKPATERHQTVTNIVFGSTCILLLVAILSAQVIILKTHAKLFLTLMDLRIAKTGVKRRSVIDQIPLVRIQGGSVDAVIQGTVDVEIQNTRLDVEMYR